ncbi:uncharacterized protein LOC107025600 [Solanum pennellii]|uniref:Uncharacterized protein LOC107025600 n=1 Tax=Solanum pennellii TaxID=28526 RepID=A0ABM1H8B2_SOLPN|nr:uncharacterized protein LOC107025600 [Solanum pennellii]
MVKSGIRQAWRAKEKAMKFMRGDPTESYAKLPGYAYILEQHISWIVLKIEKKECDKFLYTFVALEACIRGWEYCRPIVVVDGACLKYSYGGTMLTASTMNPGGHILMLAYAIVDSEMTLYRLGSLNSLKKPMELSKTCVLCQIEMREYEKRLLLYISNSNIMPAYGT